MLLTVSCSRAGSGGGVVSGEDGTQWRRMTVERLPDMNEPRGNHRTVVIGDEIVVLGGHTEGFKPIETAEYFVDGVWHTVPMLYPHLNGFAAQLQDGSILLGGGSAEAFGIGQSWGAEIYAPASHSFSAAGIMSAKRAMPSAVTLPDGKVVIVGNWHAPDSYEFWSAEGGFAPGGPLSPGWAEPFVLPASQDDIIVFGPWDTVGNSPAGRVDHLGGEAEFVPLLEEWEQIYNYYVFPEDIQIAEYTYLVPASIRSGNECTIIKVASGEFSLLEMAEPLPAKGPDGTPIEWLHLQVDRPSRLIWVQGMDPETERICMARISYDATLDGGKATSTYYFAEMPDDIPINLARLLPGGRFVLAGGTGWKKGTFPVEGDFFKTYSTVFMLHTEPMQEAGLPLWALLVGIVVVGVGVLLFVGALRRKGREPEASGVPSAAEESKDPRNLMEEISTLIEEKELFRRKNLRITDVASELATNKTYVSVLLNNLSGESFSKMITRYRIDYAKKLLREHPDMLLDEVADESGFSSYTTFFRSFKTATGLSPQEWKRQQ